MFAYKFSMNTAGERSLSLHPAVSLSKPEWTTAGKTKRGCSGAHIEAGDRLDDFRTRETARAVGASIAFLFFFRVYIQHLHVLWHGKAYGARRPWNLLRPKINRSTSASHRYLIYLEILNTSIITFFLIIIGFRYAPFFIPLESFFRMWERAFPSSWLSVHR